MELLSIPPTKTTFGINFDPHKRILVFTGNSYPPNALDFFDPLIDWVKKFVSNTESEVRVEFKVNYYNTTSSKYIFKIMEILEKHHKKTARVRLLWYFNEAEEDLYESWISLIQELDLPHELIPENNA